MKLNFTFAGKFFEASLLREIFFRLHFSGEIFKLLLHFVGFMWGTYLGPAKCFSDAPMVLLGAGMCSSMHWSVGAVT